MKKIPGKELLVQLNDNHQLQLLYNSLLPSIERHVIKNSGNKEDAKDIFQESVVVAYRKAQDPSFVLTSSLETFIFSIAKRKWLYELKKRGRHNAHMEISPGEGGNNIEQMVINNERTSLYLKHFRALPAGCKKILTLFFEGYKMSEIAEKLGFASEGYARKRKHQCQETLIKFITKDKSYKELNHE